MSKKLTLFLFEAGPHDGFEEGTKHIVFELVVDYGETEAPTTLVFQRGIDYNVYLDGRQVSITVLK